jgi:hypothetical protein
MCAAMLPLVNQASASAGQGPLSCSRELDNVTQAHSNDQARMRRMTHDGEQPRLPFRTCMCQRSCQCAVLMQDECSAHSCHTAGIDRALCHCAAKHPAAAVTTHARRSINLPQLSNCVSCPAGSNGSRMEHRINPAASAMGCRQSGSAENVAQNQPGSSAQVYFNQ